MSANPVVSKVAVVGCGISGAICASTLAKNGVSVTVFESARGPGGRMSQRRETCEDGKELLFDHGAPLFTVSDPEVTNLVHEWESRGIVAEWKENFGSFDCLSRTFTKIEQDGLSKRYVGVPGMNSICKALSSEPGVESKFRVGVGKLEWLEDENLWSLIGVDGQNLGHFTGVVVTNNIISSPRFTDVFGRPAPLDPNLAPRVTEKLQNLPVKPHWALMLAFAEPLSLIPMKGFTIRKSEILSWAHCDNSKPGRSSDSEQWLLHSTAEYATGVIARTGLQQLSNATLAQVAEELFQEFQNMGLGVPQPFFKKAHRWGAAFPAASIAAEEKCLWDGEKKLAVCGDFCVSPNVEGAILSGLAAASKLRDILSLM